MDVSCILSLTYITYTKIYHAIVFAKCRTHRMFDALHALALAENSINPEKYIVESYPAIRSFPVHHPNRKLHVIKDEL